MNINEKLNILADSAKYDASCSSSGSERKNVKGGIGNGSVGGICHSFASDGRCISLLKILMTNSCIFDCKYCINRKTNNVKRAIFSPEEICELTINFYKRNYIEGLFLSSGIIKSSDYTMEKIIETVYLLRNKYHFNGYIHTKAIPGCSEYLVKKLGTMVDRMSANIEMPSKRSLELLAPNKSKEKITSIMTTVAKNHSKSFVRAGQSTQMIIGGSNDTDKQIMGLSSAMYDKYRLKRVYYSAYVPINNDSLLPAIKTPPLVRENRLYQADFLLRFYNFKVNDLLSDDKPNFNVLIDPKAEYALRNINNYPVEINKASYYELLKVPGIGVFSAKKIIQTRKFTNLTFDNLKKMGIVMKRAKFFITCNGKYFIDIKVFNERFIESNLVREEKSLITTGSLKQLSLFEQV